MTKNKLEITDTTTGEKIKEAARKVFTKKGYAATRTRDIAEEAGINLALLNYYFRSKEKLFDIVMRENMQQLLIGLRSVLYNETTTLLHKIKAIVSNYINLLRKHPDLPLFILSEIKANPDKFAMNIGARTLLLKSHFFKQVKETGKGKINPIQIIINIIGLTVFPFIASPLLKHVGDLNQKEFDALMKERKKMIPIWINGMLKVK
ncbi:MAG: TetR/AcrR family transcriptional regulator [Bacteroidia bacterium]|nr:TetR/AcrR family transcriptional regulator [Bacteroidia bacterium]